ncbi:MAG: DNA-directed RNA polymerase subunit K [archaeon]|nr:MAG: DNA-directed RNA polymerase subunit K [archaeon]
MKNFSKEEYTKYEIARILGARALQISANAPILLKLTKEQLEEMHYDAIKIAEAELEAGILPITIKRPMPKKTGPSPEFKEVVEKEEPPIPKKEDKPVEPPEEPVEE